MIDENECEGDDDGGDEDDGGDNDGDGKNDGDDGGDGAQVDQPAPSLPSIVQVSAPKVLNPGNPMDPGKSGEVATLVLVMVMRG